MNVTSQKWLTVVIWLSWTIILHIDQLLMDRLTLVLVKLLSRLKNMFIQKNISRLFLYGSSVSWVLKTLFCKYCISPQDEDPYGAITNVFGYL